MTFFQFKSFSFSFSFVNRTIKRIVQYIKSNGKFYIANLTNETFWKDPPRGQEILEFFGGMTHSQKIEFLGCFDIFVVGFHNGINAYVTMTADPSSRNFKKTVLVSISKGYNLLRERFSGRETPLIECDLRSLIDSTPVQSAEFPTSSVSGFESSIVERAFKEGLSTFGPFKGFDVGSGPAIQPVSPLQGFASGFPLSSTQPPSIGGYFQPIMQRVPTDPFTSQENFISVKSTDGPLHRQEKTCLAIRKGRICRVEIPSGCSSGPSTSSTVGRIAKSSKAKTPVSTTIANLEKRIARLERKNLSEESPDYLTLVVSKAKLKRIQYP